MSVFEVMLIISSITAQFEKDFDVKVTSRFSTVRLCSIDKPKVKQCFIRGPNHAVCYLRTNEIAVNIDHFISLPPRHRKELIYHELGHCELFLKHTKDSSIMKPKTYAATKKPRNWPKLLRDMKNLLKNPKNKYKYSYRD